MGKTKNTWNCRHKDCKYKARPGSANGCDYTFITGKDRRAGLPKEKHAPYYCDKYEPGARIKKPREGIVIERRKANTYSEPREPLAVRYAPALEILKQAHSEGLSDGQIAERLDWPRGRAVYWRKKLGLESNIPKCNTKYDLALCEKMYKEGRKDVDIAEALGCTSHNIRNWRNRRGLPPNV